MIPPLNRLMAVLALCGLLVPPAQAEGDSVGSSDPPRTPEQARIALSEWGIEYTQSAFLERVKKGDLFAVRLFRDAGMDLHAPREDHGWTPLMSAASSKGNQEAAVRFLVEHGADIHAQDNYRRTALLVAVSSWPPGPQEAAVRFLVEHGADVNAQDRDGMTVLMHAAGEGALEVVRFLVEHGAEIDAQDHRGRTALHWAHSGKEPEFGYDGNVEVVRFLMGRWVAEAGAKAQTADGKTTLHWAVLSDDLERVESLLDHGVNVNAQDKSGRTALHWVAELEEKMEGPQPGDIEIVRLLVEHGANINARTDDGRTPLHQAARKGRLEVARLLVEHGADINARTNRGWTPLHQAAYHSPRGFLEVVRFLVEHGADINARTDRDRTVLSMLKATRRQQQEVRDFLTEIGIAE